MNFKCDDPECKYNRPREREDVHSSEPSAAKSVLPFLNEPPSENVWYHCPDCERRFKERYVYSHGDKIISFVKYHGVTLFASRDKWNEFIELVKGKE